MFSPFHHLSPGISLQEIASPQCFNDLGHHFLQVANLLVECPIHEVRESCITAIKNGGFHHSCSKAFQSKVKLLGENHNLVQRAIVALSYDHAGVAVILAKLYLQFSSNAYFLDRRYSLTEDFQSNVMLAKAVRFVVKLFLVKNPKLFHFGVLENNVLYNDPRLLKVLFSLITAEGMGRKEKELFFSGLTLNLHHLAKKAHCVLEHTVPSRLLSEQTWSLFFEETYRFACKVSCDHPWYIPRVALQRLRDIAYLIEGDRIHFEQDPDFGRLTDLRARAICERYLMLRSKDWV